MVAALVESASVISVASVVKLFALCRNTEKKIHHRVHRGHGAEQSRTLAPQRFVAFLRYLVPRAFRPCSGHGQDGPATSGAYQKIHCNTANTTPAPAAHARGRLNQGTPASLGMVV